MKIHVHAAAGNVAALENELANGISAEAVDENGRTPLMVAVESPKADLETLRFLLSHGANVNGLSAPTRENEAAQSVLSIAAKTASLEKIKLLLTGGADANFVDANGYSILLSALYGSFAHPAGERLERIRCLVDGGTPLDVVSKFGESVLRVASCHGEFEVVKFLLDRGADSAALGWSPLFHVVLFGNAEEVARLIGQGADLNQIDAYERTPFLLGVHAGRLEIAKLLLARGSNRATRGRCGTTPLMLAISRDDAPMLGWLISEGCDVEEADDFGSFPLAEAAQHDAIECVKVLLAAGAVASRRNEYDHGAIENTSSPQIVEFLVEAGEELSDVGAEMRSRLTGFKPGEELEVSPEDYHAHRDRTFGSRNPERMNNPFWEAMVRTRASAYTGAVKFESRSFDNGPVWCFQRYGHSLTRLADGRYVEIAGEHEDHYDADFCIYNDVVVHHGDGTFDILGYPETDFPTTDFHSATLVPPYIYIIGNLGYPAQRRPGETPVYRLHCKTWRIERVPTRGEMPGWIHRHKAQAMGNHQIRISGGRIDDGSENALVENTQNYILNLADFTWRVGCL
jgi:ankyrin repeat protein